MALVFFAAPFIALAFASRRLGGWLAVGCALVLIGVFLEAEREASASTSSTAALVLIVVPFVQAALLVAVVTLNEIARWAIRWRRRKLVPDTNFSGHSQRLRRK